MARRRPQRSALLVGAVLLNVSPLAAATAHAQQISALQCEGTDSDSYAPGVVFQPRDFTITLTARFDTCLDTTGQVTSGGYGPEQFTLHAACNDLLDGFQGPRTFAWSTGDSSVFEGTGQSTEVAGQVITTITGTIAQGRFQGHSAVQTITLPQPGLLQCLTTGYTGATGVTTLTIT